MTCIVGLIHDGSVYIGGDSAGVAGYDVTTRGDEKVFKNGPMIMGFTTSFRMGQLLRYAFKVPVHPKEKDDMSYLFTNFVDAVRKCFSNKGFLKKSSGEESGGTFLLGYRGGLYVIDSDFQVAIPTEGYAAVGCGSDVALGALCLSEEWTDPIVRVNAVLDAASRFNAAVSPPYTILKMGKHSRK